VKERRREEEKHKHKRRTVTTLFIHSRLRCRTHSGFYMVLEHGCATLAPSSSGG
jgi:hypothetical protein